MSLVLRAAGRRGFTLLELMMVILILGMLMALLTTAVQGAREASRRTVCLNTIRKLSQAMAAYELRERKYPGWMHHPYEAVDATNARPFTYSTSWFPQLLDDLDHSFLTDRTIPLTWRRPLRNGSATYSYAPPLHPLAVCPSEFDKMQRKDPLLSYAVNCGRKDVDPTATLPADWRANGVFHNLWSWRVNPTNRVATVKMDSSFIEKGDGLSNTLLLAENVNATLYYDRNETTNGFVFDPPSVVGAGFRAINGPGFGGDYSTARPSSRHPGGVNVAFAGQNARFIRDNIDYAVYVQLMTTKGENAQEPGSQTPSEAAIRNARQVKADDL